MTNPPTGAAVPQDGGPAFPHPEQCRSDGIAHWPQPGMSLRDWFAGQALAGVMEICKHDTLRNDETRADMFARNAYFIADALLSARGEPK